MSSSNQWIVGYFEEENKYSVIPSKWLVSCGNIWISKWPKYGNVPKLIKSLSEPGMDWPTYPVKIVSEFFTEYDEAILKEKQIFMAAPTSESENNVQTKKKKKKSYIQPDHDDSDTCSSTPQTSIKIINNESSSNITLNKPKLPMKLMYDEGPPISYLLNTNTIRSAYNFMYSMTEEDIISGHNIVQSPITTTVDQNNLSMSIQNNMSTSTAYIDEQTSSEIKNELDSSKNQNDITQMIYENSIATPLAYVKRIEDKLETVVSGEHVGNTCSKIFKDILTQLPMKTISDVEYMETKCTIDDNFELELRNVLQTIGGTNLKNFVKRSLQKLFTNELATKYNWTGFRQHEPLQTLRVIQILKGIAINTFPSTEANFETHVKDWFRYGSQHYSREKK